MFLSKNKYLIRQKKKNVEFVIKEIYHSTE